MIKKLRNRFLILNMSITSFVMLAAFAVVYLTTYYNIQSENSEKLTRMSGVQVLSYNSVVQDAGGYGITGAREIPIDTSDEYNLYNSVISPDYALSFSIEVDEVGEIRRVESFIDLTTETYVQAAAIAWSTRDGGKIFPLAGKQWLFAVAPIESHLITQSGMQIVSGDGFRISFLDVTDSQKTLNDLLLTLGFVALGILAVIFVVSLYFANRSIKPIETAWEKQRQFVADASHELKTPLSVVTANYDVLLAHEDETVKSQGQWLGYMRLGLDRMARLLGDLLSLASLEDVKKDLPSKARFNMSEAIAEELRPMEAIAAQRGITMTSSLDAGIVVNSSEETVRRVFAILLDNALKYTDESGTIAVRLEEGKRRAVCTVENTVGDVAAQSFDRVFDRFYRADESRGGESGGYGLGLPIAKAMVESLGGKITARVQDGVVSFTFCIAA